MSYQNQDSGQGQGGEDRSSSGSSMYPRLHHNEEVVYEEIRSTSPPPASAPPDYDVQNLDNEIRRYDLTEMKFRKCLYKIILFYVICAPIFLIGLIFLTVTYTSSPVSSARTYGEICNKTHLLPTRPTTTTTALPPLNSELKVHERVKRELPFDACDMTLWLECRNITNETYADPAPDPNFYACLCPWDLSWDKDVGACVSSPPNGTCADNHFTDLRPLKCVSNARCRHTESNKPGTCECNEEYTLTTLGGCRLTYNTTKGCTRDEECNWEVGNLKCIEGKCLCSEQKIWDVDEDKCLGRAETRCNTNEPCYRNSQCNTTSGVCKCNPDFINNQEGLCVKLYNAPCYPTPGKIECADTLACLGNTTVGYKCLCREDHMLDESDPLVKRCIGTAGADCSKDTGGGVSCVDDATCVPNGQNAACICNEGFESNVEEKLCKKKFNEICSNSTECNEYKYLACNSGTCGCATDYKADGNDCKGLERAPCRIGSDCWANSLCPTEGVKICTCQALYYASPDRTCMGQHGTACTTASPCNPLGLLNCTSGSCQCATKYIHQEAGERGCVAKADNSCDSDSDFPNVSVVCVKNATCTTEKMCQCDGNLVSNSEGKCASSSSILSVSVSLIFMSILILFSNHSN